jgi:hypothetical protein
MRGRPHDPAVAAAAGGSGDRLIPAPDREVAAVVAVGIVNRIGPGRVAWRVAILVSATHRPGNGRCVTASLYLQLFIEKQSIRGRMLLRRPLQFNNVTFPSCINNPLRTLTDTDSCFESSRIIACQQCVGGSHG